MSNTSAPPATAAISLRTTAANSKWLNAVCPKCQQPLALGDQVVLCPKCYTPQHAQCWRENGNQCAIDQTPARIIERTPRPGAAAAGAAPAPPVVAQAATPAAPAPAAPVPAPAPPAVPAAAGSVPELSDPWPHARVVEAPPTTDLWRRNVMTVVVITFLWALALLAVYVAEAFFQVGPGLRLGG